MAKSRSSWKVSRGASSRRAGAGPLHTLQVGGGVAGVVEGDVAQAVIAVFDGLDDDALGVQSHQHGVLGVDGQNDEIGILRGAAPAMQFR